MKKQVPGRVSKMKNGGHATKKSSINRNSGNSSKGNKSRRMKGY